MLSNLRNNGQFKALINKNHSKEEDKPHSDLLRKVCDYAVHMF